MNAALDLPGLQAAAKRYREHHDADALRQLHSARLALADTLLGFTPEQAERAWNGAGEAKVASAPTPDSWWRRVFGGAARAASVPEALCLPLHGLLLQSGVALAPRGAADNDCMSRARQCMLSSEGLEAGAMAAMLFGHAHEFPPPRDLAEAHDWFRSDYVAWLIDMPPLFHAVGEADGYQQHMLAALRRLRDYVERRPRPADAQRLAGLFLGAANFVQTYFNSANLRELMALRGAILARALLDDGNFLVTAMPPRIAGGRIRLGLLASRLMAYADIYFMLSHFQHLDRARFDITLFAQAVGEGELVRRCVASADRVVALPPDDIAAQARLIRAADLDLLLFGSNVSAVVNAEAALGSHRLARVQIASVSSPVTTGLAAMDIMLSADWNEPPGAAAHYTEHLVRMPGGLGCYAFQYDEGRAGMAFDRARLGIADGRTVFFSGANFYKLLPELVDAWAEILRAVPGSVLVLMPFSRGWSGEYSNQALVERVSAQMRAAGVDPQRVKFLQPVPSRADMHRILALADVYLDAYPFAGACSMIDPLQVGVPPVAWYGDAARSRHGFALLCSVGLPELAADSKEGYVQTALRLARDPALRADLRARLPAARLDDPLPVYFDTAAFSRKAGVALQSLFDAAARRAQVIGSMSAAALRTRLLELASELVGKARQLDGLSDEWIARHLALPYLRALQHEGRTPLLIDVGACYGSMSLPFVEEGWEAVLFEPDPDARQILERNLAPHHARCRVVGAAVDRTSGDDVDFHKNATAGLSGLSASRYGQEQRVISVPRVSLVDYCRDAGVRRVDFLKIDAEGHDFDALEGFDFSSMQPALVLVEYGTQFPRQSRADIAAAIARMRGHGYAALVFGYDDDGQFAKGVWSYRLVELLALDEPRDSFSGTAAFGNILFHRADDTVLLAMLVEMLEGCLPRDLYWKGLLEEGAHADGASEQ